VYRDLRRRFWCEATASGSSAALLGVTLAWPDWIELASRVDPDHGSGLLEWLIVLVSFMVAVCASAAARREWRRSVTLNAPAPATPGPQPPGRA
jgi:hypothetical protein